MEEIWRKAKYIYSDGTVKDFSDSYEVSSYGSVRSLDKYVDVAYGGKQFRKGIILKPIIHSVTNNYNQILYRLSSGGKVCNIIGSRLIASSFPEICGEWFEGAEVNHKDENPLNNIATNLEWCTHLYNNNYLNHNTNISSAKKKPIIQYSLSGDVVKEWDSIISIEESTGYFKQNISSCCRGKYKQAYGYIWKYKN